MDLDQWNSRLQSEYPDAFATRYFATVTSCETIEYLHYPHLPEPQLLQGSIHDKNLADWFEKDLSLPSDSITAETNVPIGGFRLMIATYDEGEHVLSINKKAIPIIEKHIHISHLSEIVTTSFNFASFDSKPQGAVHPPQLSLSLFNWLDISTRGTFKYDPLSKLVLGFIFVTREHLAKSLISLLKVQSRTFNHPMFLPTMLVQCYQEYIANIVTTIETRVMGAMTTLGQDSWGDDQKGPDIDLLDYSSITSNMNDSGDDIARVKEISQMLSNTLDKIRNWKCSIMKHSSEVTETEVPSQKPDNTTPQLNDELEMDSCIRYLEDDRIALNLRTDRVQYQLQLTLQVVYQFGAQKDARVNIELARSSAAIAKASKEDSAIMRQIAIESKKDSSAMKTIAFLTMFFLPGTFVAALFAMPIFDWDENGQPSLKPTIKPGFKLYWALTAPLTAVVLLLWAFAILLPWKRWLAKYRKQDDELEDDDVEKNDEVQSSRASTSSTTSAASTRASTQHSRSIRSRHTPVPSVHASRTSLNLKSKSTHSLPL